MCVISLSPKGVALPSNDDIKLMFEKNPHGAGFAIDHGGGEVEYHKGYMTLDKFMEALNKYDGLKDKTVALHFRITTKGKTNPQTTHPNRITNKFNEMRELHGLGKFNVMFHNGTFAGLGGVLASVSSDSQDFAAGPAYLLMNDKKKISSIKKAMFNALRGESRVLIMRGNDEPEMYGDWKEHTDGCYYSNMLWQPAKTTVQWGTLYTKTTQDYRKTYMSVSGGIHPAQYGRLSYKSIWPSTHTTWIKTETEEHLDRILSACETETEDFFTTSYTHKQSGKKFFRTGDVTITTDKGFESLLDYLYDKIGLNKKTFLDEMKTGLISLRSKNEMDAFISEVSDEQIPVSIFIKGELYHIDYHEFQFISDESFSQIFLDKYDDALEHLELNGTISNFDETEEDLQACLTCE